MKHLLIQTALLILALSVGFAQGISFKELHESMSTSDPFSNMLNLRTYQQTNPDHAIAYFLLGEIYDNYMRETDPTRQFIMLESHYNQVKTYYSLLQAKLTEHQASQDREYYGEIENISGKRKIGYPDIIHDVRKKADEATLFFENAKTVHESYVNCINKYNECLFSFREIVSIYPYFKDLYLLAPPSVVEKIDILEKNYRESVLNFERYHNACKELPKLLKAPHLIEMPIVTYRLEGLVESDFTADTVKIWNYGKWALDFRQVMNDDIKTIREQLITCDKKLDLQTNELLQQERYYEEPNTYKPDERFQFLIGKYDPHSLCNRLLDYKSSKIGFLAQARLSINDPEKAADHFLGKRLRYFKDLALNLDQLNNEAALLKESVSLSGIDRYFDFFESRYKGMDGLKRWCDVEQYQNRAFFNNMLNNLGHFLQFEEKKNEFSGLCARYKDKPVPLGVMSVDDNPVISDTLVSLFFETQGRNKNMVSGLLFGKDSLFVPYLAQTDTAGQVKWMVFPSPEKIDKKTQNCWPSEMIITSDSSVLLLLTVLDKVDARSPKNFLLKFDKNGQQSFSALIDTCGYARFLGYDEIAEEYLLITKGTERTNRPTNVETVTISLLGGEPFKTRWKYQFELTGSIVGVLTTNANFLIVGNDLEGNNTGEGQKQYSGFSTFIERNGQVSKTYRYTLPEGVWLSKALKATSQHMALYGQVGNDRADKNLPLFLLVNETGGLEFKNLDKLKTVTVPYTTAVPGAPLH